MIRSVPLPAVLLILLLSCTACRSAALLTDAQSQDLALLPAGSLPAPSELLRHAQRTTSLIDTPLSKSGDAYDPALPHNLVTAQPDASAKFAALSASGAAPLEKIAYCTYRFNANGFDGPLDFAHGWAIDLRPSNQAYLAAANFASDAWDWYTLLPGKLASVPDKAQHMAGDGTVLIVIAISGLEQPALLSLMLNNHPPQASLTSGDALSGLPGLTVLLDGSASTDEEGSIADFAWDPEGDGSFLPHGGSGTPTYLATYCAPGTYHPTLRVTDGEGATASISLTVTTGLGSVFTIQVDNVGSSSADDVALCNLGGKPAVAYFAGTQVRYCAATTASGDTWFSPQVLANDAGYIGLDMELSSERPAIAYNGAANELRCVWANDNAGTDWPDPKTAVPGGDEVTGAWPVLDAGSELPRAAYGDGAAFFAGNIWFVRATASNLSDWSTPLQLNSDAVFGAAPALAWIDGLPAVSFTTAVGSEAGRMQYVRANMNWDVDWPFPISPLPSGQQVQNGECLAEIGGLPAILYHENDLPELRLLRGKDTAGLQWEDPVQVGNAPGVNFGAYALRLVNGVPCVAYVSEIELLTGGLHLVYASDSQGSAWGEPLRLDNGALAVHLSLIDLNGTPAVAWSDPVTKDINYLSFTP